MHRPLKFFHTASIELHQRQERQASILQSVLNLYGVRGLDNELNVILCNLKQDVTHHADLQ